MSPSGAPAPARRLIASGLTVALVVLLALEVLARGALAVFPAINDPWSSKAAGRFFQGMESDLRVVAERQRLYVEDRALFWRLAPGVTMQVENAAVEPREDPLFWSIHTNDRGFRGPVLPAGPAGLRVIEIGDSSTFGFRVNDDDTYPERLAGACRAAGHADVHILNAGVPGYTSYQGKVLLRSLLDTYHPNVVTLAFGANDRQMEPISDAEWGAWLNSGPGRLMYAVEHLGLYRLFAGVIPRRTAARGGALRDRVGIPAYRANLDEMIVMAQQASARVVLLDLTYFAPIYRYVLRDLSTTRHVPLVDGPALFDDTFQRIERGEGYQEESRAWLDFYQRRVKDVRPVYFDRAFYQTHYATDAQRRQFTMLMADPIHPSPIGHRILADALAPLVCGAPQ